MAFGICTMPQGRIRAEQELRRLQLQAASAKSSGEASSAASPGLCSYPVQPIGIMQSCFSQRPYFKFSTKGNGKTEEIVNV
eukprot:365220-Chlamydomonas_euryale.AAC.4